MKGEGLVGGGQAESVVGGRYFSLAMIAWKDHLVVSAIANTSLQHNHKRCSMFRKQIERKG